MGGEWVLTIAAWSIVVDFDKTPLFHLGVIDITSLILVRMDQLGRRQRSRSRFLRLAPFSQELNLFYTKTQQMQTLYHTSTGGAPPVSGWMHPACA
jgi:hypothetical protein